MLDQVASRVLTCGEKKILLFGQIQKSISWTSQTGDEGFLIDNSGANQPPTGWLKIYSHLTTYGTFCSMYLQMRVKMSDSPGKKWLGECVWFQHLKISCGDEDREVASKYIRQQYLRRLENRQVTYTLNVVNLFRLSEKLIATYLSM